MKAEVLSKIVRNALLDGRPRVARQAIRQCRRSGLVKHCTAVVTTIASSLSDW